MVGPARAPGKTTCPRSFPFKFPIPGHLFGFGHLHRVHEPGDVIAVFDGAVFMLAVLQLRGREGIPHVRLHQILRNAFPLVIQRTE